MTIEYDHNLTKLTGEFNVHPDKWEEIEENSSQVEKINLFEKIKPLAEIAGANPTLLNSLVRNGGYSVLTGTLSIEEYSQILNIIWDSRTKSLREFQTILPPKIYQDKLLHELIDGQISEENYESLLPKNTTPKAALNAFGPSEALQPLEPTKTLIQEKIEQIVEDKSKGYPKRLKQLIAVAGNMPHIIPIILDSGKDKYLYEVDQITLEEYKEVLRLAQIKRSQFLERCKARFGDDKKSFVEMLDDELLAGRILPEDHIRLNPQNQGTFTHQF